MKNLLALTTLIIALTGCKAVNNSREAPKLNRSADGHYIVTPTVMKGECEAPEPIVLVIWKNEVHNDGIHGDLEVTGTLDGYTLDGIATASDDSVFFFDAWLSSDTKYLVGEWRSADGECEGPLSGERI